MSRDEILTMEAGREMNELIAEKIMGWIKYNPNISTEYNFDGWFIKCPDGLGLCVESDDWSPSTDMTAAWQVVEKMDMPFYLERKDDWFAMFGDELDYSANADTAPLAICRAALLATIGGQE